jgi:hypothetical protein
MHAWRASAFAPAKPRLWHISHVPKWTGPNVNFLSQPGELVQPLLLWHFRQINMVPERPPTLLGLHVGGWAAAAALCLATMPDVGSCSRPWPFKNGSVTKLY